MNKKSFAAYQDLLLGALGLIFAVVVIGTYIWAISRLTASLNAALLPGSVAAPRPAFNLVGAAALNLGVESTTASSVPSAVDR